MSMMTASELPETLPLFPLPGALLLPRSRLPLHIFEPRYLAMVDHCLTTPSRMIGMIQPRAVPEGEAPRLHAIGCAGRLTAFSETDDRRYMITLGGVSRFRILSEIRSEAPFRSARVAWGDFPRDIGPAESDAGLDRPAFLDLLKRYFAAVDLSAEWGSLRGAEDEPLLNTLSMLCPFAPEERQALLEAPSLATRRETLVMLMEFALRGQTGGPQGVVQ